MQGFVLVHGKLSGPSAYACSLAQTAAILSEQGHIVDYVDYAWSRGRHYDSTLEQSIAEISAAIDRVKAQGALQVHLVGHSMGANALMYYATLHENFDHLILMCPSHNTHLEKFQQLISWCIDQARLKIAAGEDSPQPYIDFHLSRAVVEYISPTAYVSYFDNTGNCNMVTNAAKLLVKPVLFVIGQHDITTPMAKELIFNQIKHNCATYLFMPDQTHHSVTSAAVPAILQQIKSI